MGDGLEMMSGNGLMSDMPGWMVTGIGIAGLIWLLIGIAVLVLIVAAFAWLAVRVRGDASSGGRTPTALDELDHRYARGELDRDTYLQMRRDLVGR